jgi:hypothetical protein
MAGGAAPDRIRDKISGVNARLGAMLNDARLALRGERVFDVEHVRAISHEVSEMAPVWSQAPELRLLRPDLEGELDLYKSQLGNLHVTLQQVEQMLLAQRAQMEASRAQLAAISQFASTLQQTR